MADIYLDCKGLNCPLPIVNIGRKLKEMSIGQTIEVEANDPAFKADVIAFVKQLQHSITFLEEGDVVKVLIRKER